MSASVNIYEAKTQLSRLIERALAGEDVVIARAGTPVARLVPYRPPGEPQRRRLGAWRGRVHISEDFDELPDDVAAAFRGDLP